MAFVPADKGIEVVINYDLMGQEAINTFWFKAQGNPTVTDLNNAANLVYQWWADMRLGLSQDLIGSYIAAYDRTSQTGEYYVSNAISGTTGGHTDESLPSTVSFRVTFQTGFQGRSSRGCNYLAGVPRGLVNGNIIHQNFQTYVDLAYNGLRDSANTAGLPWCVCSRYHDGMPRVLGVMVPIISVSYKNHIADMGRRVPGHGV